jgi:hypothetical protein
VGLVLDTGGLIGFERGDRVVAALVEAARRRREPVVTSSGCVAQAWRGDSRQALLARLLHGLDEQGLDRRVSRAVGALCAAGGSADVIDAHVALLAHDEDVVLTSDSPDIRRLLEVRGCRAEVKPC